MPLPKRRSDESVDDFSSRCMADPKMRSEFPDEAQRFAVCRRQAEKLEKTEELRFVLKGDLSTDDLAQSGGLAVADQSLDKKKKRRRGLRFDLARKSDGPVNESVRGYGSASADGYLAIKKVDAALQIVWGEVYVPYLPDTQGDFMTPDEIRDMAHLFAKSMKLDQIDRQHDKDVSSPQGCVVETFIAREDDALFVPHAWVVGVHVADPGVWAQIERGELNGFSLDGLATRTEKQFDLLMPDSVTGRTAAADGHDHEFEVEFGDQGQFLGGWTGPGGADDHVHKIQKGTVTEMGGEREHAHRYAVSASLLEVAFGRVPPPAEMVAE
jgi:hypothetical protein